MLTLPSDDLKCNDLTAHLSQNPLPSYELSRFYRADTRMTLSRAVVSLPLATVVRAALIAGELLFTVVGFVFSWLFAVLNFGQPTAIAALVFLVGVRCVCGFALYGSSTSEARMTDGLGFSAVAWTIVRSLAFSYFSEFKVLGGEFSRLLGTDVSYDFQQVFRWLVVLKWFSHFPVGVAALTELHRSATTHETVSLVTGILELVVTVVASLTLLLGGCCGSRASDPGVDVDL